MAEKASKYIQIEKLPDTKLMAAKSALLSFSEMLGILRLMPGHIMNIYSLVLGISWNAWKCLG